MDQAALLKIADQIARLPKEKADLLRLMLIKQGIDIDEQFILPQPREGDDLPLSFAQQRLWFLDQLEPNSPGYNIPLAARLRGRLDLGILQRTVDEIVNRHESLRTRFVERDQEPRQVIAPEMDLRIKTVDLEHLAPDDREPEALKLAREESQLPFALSQGPLLRVTVIRLADDDHLALFTMHHIIGDGWSMGVLLREVAALYSAFASGSDSPLQALPIQYGDYAVWQRARLQGERLERELEFWRDTLGGELPVFELPTDRPRPAMQSSAGDTYAQRLPKALGQTLIELGRAVGATPFMTIVGLLVALLHRYTGDQELCIGTPVANRDRNELAGLVGFFVNTLVLRVDAQGEPTFRQLLERVRQTALAAYAHQQLPFEMVVEEVAQERTLSQTPLFQVMVSQQDLPGEGIQLPGLVMTPIQAGTGIAKFDLSLDMTETAEGLELGWEYSTELYDLETIQRMSGHLVELARSATASPDVPIADLEYLPVAEREQVLYGWNDSGVPIAAQCVHELFEAQVARRPDAVAVSEPWSDKSWSYSELNRRANQVAHRLQALGTGPDCLVGLCMDRSLEMTAGLLGILKSGGAYLPLDPVYPQERLEMMMDDAGIDLILTEEHLSDRLPHQGIRQIWLDQEWAELGRESDTNPVRQVGPDSLAYVIYTSGSTGRPKGVMVTHRGVVNHNLDVVRRFGLTADDRVLQFSTINFDAAVEEIFPSWVAGARLVLRGREALPTGEELLGLMEAEQITVLDLPTAYWHELVYEAGLTERAAPPSLRFVVVGGEAAAAEKLADWQAFTGPQVRWMNTYGPTEGTIIATAYEPAPDQRPEPIPIGAPIQNVTAYILDEHLRPVGIGFAGELYIGGDGVARGYLSRPDLTADRFVPDPFGPLEGGRLYRTGDLCRFLPDGNIEFLGRADDQVKIRGYRVELGEIEAALRTAPGVRDGVVIAGDDPGGQKRLLAYLVPQDGSDPDLSAVQRHLESRLPGYMVPLGYQCLEEIPLMPNGKLNRRALPEAQLSGRADRYVAPRTPDEEIIAGIWCEVLGLERVGVEDSFFELGGHSLLATQMSSRVRKTFGVNLALRVLFERPTVTGLATEVSHQRDTVDDAPPITPASREGELPLSFAQQRLWFLDQLDPGSAMYNIPDAVRIEGVLNVEVLQRALNGIVARHEALRTTFVTEAGVARQVIAPELALTLEIEDLSELPEGEREAQARRLGMAEARGPFDLATGPLIRARLLRLGTDESILLLTTHHIVSDGWSANVLTAELAALYQAFAEGKESPLEPLSLQYADYASWQRAWLQGDVLEAQLDYWRNALANPPPLLELPTDRSRPAIQSDNGDYFSFRIDPELADSLRGFCREEGATLYMALLAAFQALLHRYSGQDDICVGTPVANRTRGETETLVGFFVNTLVMRADLTGEPSYGELVARVREAALGAYAHQDVPFEMVVDAVQVERRLNQSPLFQVMFSLQHADAAALEIPGLTLRPVEVTTGIALFDLTLMMSEDAEGIGGGFEYNTDLFDSETIERIAGHFVALLRAMVHDSQAPVARLDYLSVAEREQVLHGWNQTAAPLPDLCLHEPFEAQARQTPDAVAVLEPWAGGRSWTYAELDRRANQLGCYLQSLGVGPGTLVGLCVERSLEMAAGLLGILKAGGAYLPLDPVYPQERLAMMVEDSGLELVLTQAPLSERIPGTGLRRVLLDQEWHQIEHEPARKPVSPVCPDDLAYVIYTSGSTGRPKGVMVPHRGVVNHNLDAVKRFGLDASDRMLQFATINFDAAVEEIFPTWAAGARLVLRGPQALPSGEELLDLVEAEGITILDLPTAYWHELVYEASLLSKPLPSSLRLVIVGGEKALAGRLESWRELAGPGLRWLNTYGPTEGTIIATVYEPGEAISEPIPIGYPIQNAVIRILDQHKQPVPIGVPGELHIGGVGVARGYLNRPDLTDAKFIADPYVAHSEGRLYCTGDRARYLPTGAIEFLGRIDNQVKLRGFRVELGEIEAALDSLPDVREAVVTLHEPSGGHPRLVAYVMLNPDAPQDVAALRRHLESTLPAYMVPGVYEFLDELPLAPNGKVDRRALPAPGTTEDASRPYTAPRTPAEEALAAIWGEVLGLERVGVEDNFFELGGDSILSIQVVARAAQDGWRVTPRQLFERQTVEQLALVAEQGVAVVAEQGLVTGPLPLTPIQSWFFEQDLVEPHHWNQALLFETPPDQSPEHLEAAVAQLVRHHDVLRHRFELTQDGVQQVAAEPSDETPFESVDLSTIPLPDRQAAITAQAAAAQASLDLAHGPIFRVLYLAMGPNQAGRLLIVAHHLVVDGVSWRVVLEDLQTAYLQAASGEAPRLPAKTTSYRTWAQRLAAHAASDAVAQEIPYWTASLPPADASLPLDHSRGPNSEASSRSVSRSLRSDETQALLRDIHAAYRTETNDILLTALAQAIARWSRQDTVWVDLEGHGREDLFEDVDVSRTVGWFTALYPVALSLRGAYDSGEAIRAIKEQLRRVPNHGIGYGIARYLSSDESSGQQLAGQSQASVTFNYLGQLDRDDGQDGLFQPATEDRGPDRSPRALRGAILDVTVVVYQDTLRVEWSFSENLHRTATIERLADDYMSCLRALIQHCQDPQAGGATPSDFGLAKISQRRLDRILGAVDRTKEK